MVTTSVIIVGGGPAGATCARLLRQQGVDCIILDKQEFPRDKLCAGWITPQVLRDVQLKPAHYPGSLTIFPELYFHFPKFQLRLPTEQFAIRRIEFDHWLLQRSGAPVYRHNVRHIQKEGALFRIDDQFQCSILIGAGGTACPVYRTFFQDSNPRIPTRQITSLEQELKLSAADNRCRLWFFENDLPGYSWYVPKAGGWLNIGIGAKAAILRQRGETIQEHWKVFQQKLIKMGLLDGDPPTPPKGHVYYVRQRIKTVRIDNAFILGDAAGLATLDMGEGIRPAVRSGIMAAKSIIQQRRFSCRHINRTSAWHLLKSSLTAATRNKRCIEQNIIA